MSAFEELGVLPELIKAVEEQEWFLPTPIQSDAIPLILGGGDVLAAAETGSGKTGAFALPVIQIVWEELRNVAKGKNSTTASSTAISIELSPTDKDPGIQIQGGVTASAYTNSWCGGRASIGVLRGKHYYEVHIIHVGNAGLARVGWSTGAARYDLGTDQFGYGFGGTGRKSNCRNFDPYGQPFGISDVIGCYADLDSGVIGFTKNGSDLGRAFTVPPNILRQGLYPAICLKNVQVSLHFGDSCSPLTFPVPPGFTPVAGANPGDTSLANANLSSSQGRAPVCLILEPSWELAEQTHKSISSFTKYLPPPSLEMALLIGGVSIQSQAQALANGVDIVTGTPGRIDAFVSDGKLSLSNIRFLVLDEADNLVANNIEIIQNVHAKIPKTKLQVLMFSATLHSEEIKQAAQTMCRFPTWVDLKGKDSVPTTVDHAVVYINPDKPPKNLVSHQITTDGMHGGVVRDLAESKSHSTKLLKAKVLLKVIDAFKMSQCIVFCRTKIDCDNLENFLLTVGGGKRHVPSRGESDFGQGVYSCVVVHADRPPAERQTNLHSFKSGEVRFLITTDLGARGIDISEVPYVINYTLPDKPEDYIHRVGRVGRADRMGLAISLVSTCPEKVWYHTCPSKGKSCGNRALRDEGGCAIWWNEPEYWSSIQQRLGMTVPQLDDNFQLPSAASTERYGQRRGEENTFVSHSGEIRDKVTQLATLEDSVQLNFWSLKGAFRF